MSKLKCGLIQMGLKGEVSMGPSMLRDRMIEAHLPLIDKAGAAGVQVLCFQEIFTQPYFCPSQDRKWYAAAEAVPDGYTTKFMQEYAKKYRMVMVVPVYEEAMAGVYYNTAAVIDADGKYLGKYRKTHIPQVDPGFYEKFFFKPGDLGYPVFQILAQSRDRRGRIEQVSVGTRAAGIGRRERRVHRRDQPRRQGRALGGEDGRVLRLQLHRQSAGEN